MMMKTSSRLRVGWGLQGRTHACERRPPSGTPSRTTWPNATTRPRSSLNNNNDNNNKHDTPRYRLVLYGKKECEACVVLTRKVKALLDRSKFIPNSELYLCELLEKDIMEEIKWQWLYGASVPEIACVMVAGADDGDGEDEEEVLLPRISHRETTDQIGKHLERALRDLGSAS